MKVWMLLVAALCVALVASAPPSGDSDVPSIQDVECAFCELAIQELLGLGSMNLSESQMSAFIKSDVCTYFSSNMADACDSLAANVPLIMLMLDGSIHPGSVCTEVGLCLHAEAPLPPDPQQLPTYQIDMDAAPAVRYHAVAQDPMYKKGLTTIYHVLQALFSDEVSSVLFSAADLAVPFLPAPFGEEISGIAKSADLPPSFVLLINLFYEITNGLACTSIVVQDAQGVPRFSRNQDLGYGMGFTHLLRNQTVHLEYVRRNASTGASDVLYESVTFGGFVGTPTAILPGKFSLAVNSRFYKGSRLEYIRSVFEELMAGTAHINTWEVRMAMEAGDNFDAVVQRLSTTTLVTSSYFIIAGTEKDQGVVLERNQTGVVLARHLDAAAGTWFLAQTNYDAGSTPPFYDNRRYYIERSIPHYCGTAGGADPGVVDFPCMYDALSTTHVLNLLTLYTAQAQNGPFATHFARRACHGNECAL